MRKEALELTKRSLGHQIFRDFEWLACSPFPVKEAKWLKDDFEGGFWSLNRAYNRLFKESKGELIVSLQDSIWIPPLGLQKFWEAYQSKGDKAIFSGVGDQYAKLDEYGKPIIKVWEDPRKTDKYGDFYRCVWNDCEWNWAAFSRKAIFDIGGTDEELDFRCRGCDQIEVCARWNAMDYKSYLDQTNESFTLRHDRSVYGGEEAWKRSHGLFNGEYNKRVKELVDSEEWPVLKYLSIDKELDDVP